MAFLDWRAALDRNVYKQQLVNVARLVAPTAPVTSIEGMATDFEAKSFQGSTSLADYTAKMMNKVNTMKKKLGGSGTGQGQGALRQQQPAAAAVNPLPRPAVAAAPTPAASAALAAVSLMGLPGLARPGNAAALPGGMHGGFAALQPPALLQAGGGVAPGAAAANNTLMQQAALQQLQLQQQQQQQQQLQLKMAQVQQQQQQQQQAAVAAAAAALAHQQSQQAERAAFERHQKDATKTRLLETWIQNAQRGDTLLKAIEECISIAKTDSFNGPSLIGLAQYLKPWRDFLLSKPASQPPVCRDRRPSADPTVDDMTFFHTKAKDAVGKVNAILKKRKEAAAAELAVRAAKGVQIAEEAAALAGGGVGAGAGLTSASALGFAGGSTAGGGVAPPASQLTPQQLQAWQRANPAAAAAAAAGGVLAGLGTAGGRAGQGQSSVVQLGGGGGGGIQQQQVAAGAVPSAASAGAGLGIQQQHQQHQHQGAGVPPTVAVAPLAFDPPGWSSLVQALENQAGRAGESSLLTTAAAVSAVRSVVCPVGIRVPMETD